MVYYIGTLFTRAPVIARPTEAGAIDMATRPGLVVCNTGAAVGTASTIESISTLHTAVIHDVTRVTLTRPY